MSPNQRQMGVAASNRCSMHQEMVVQEQDSTKDSAGSQQTRITSGPHVNGVFQVSWMKVWFTLLSDESSTGSFHWGRSTH